MTATGINAGAGVLENASMVPFPPLAIAADLRQCLVVVAIKLIVR